MIKLGCSVVGENKLHWWLVFQSSSSAGSEELGPRILGRCWSWRRSCCWSHFELLSLHLPHAMRVVQGFVPGLLLDEGLKGYEVPKILSHLLRVLKASAEISLESKHSLSLALWSIARSRFPSVFLLKSSQSQLPSFSWHLQLHPRLSSFFPPLFASLL